MSDSCWENEIYANGHQINRWPYTEVVSRVLRAAVTNQAAVLELGCGTGNNLRFLAAQGFLTFGIDSSSTAIERARELLTGDALNASLEVGDMAQLPWPDETFDLVIDRAALVHNRPDHITRILAETFRTLKAGARVISIGLKSSAHPDLAHAQRQPSGAWSHFSQGKFKGLGEVSFFSPEEAQQLFSDFDSVAMEILTRSNQYGEILDQEFIIEAIRP